MYQSRRQYPRRMHAYRIPRGSTIHDIARRFNVSIPEILAINPHVHPAYLQEGQTLFIPQPAAQGACQNYYSVQSGDTPWAIAYAHGVSLDDLMQANPGMTEFGLQIGQSLCIPSGTAAVCPSGSRQYVVQWGDTFYQISKGQGITMDALLQANPGANPDSLYVGQPLCIPEF